MPKVTPKVTVLMPVYNGAQYLKDAIDSILAQTFRDFEFLIIDDGSTDSTRNIIASYRDSRIRLVCNKHIGLTKSLNAGLALAKGNLIARQDSDDISAPQRLEQQVKYLQIHPQVSLVGSFYQIIDAQGNLQGAYSLPCHSTALRWALLFYCPFVHSAVMFRQQALLSEASENAAGGYNEAIAYAQDYDLWWRIARQQSVANLDEHLIKLRINASSMTNTYGQVVEDEPLNIQMANLQPLLALVPEASQRWPSKLLIRTLSALWLAEPETLTEQLPAEINEIGGLYARELTELIAQFSRICNAFCQFYRLDRLAQKEHSQTVFAHISKRLIAIAHYYYYEDDDEETARQILRQARALTASRWTINHWLVKLNQDKNSPLRLMT